MRKGNEQRVLIADTKTVSSQRLSFMVARHPTAAAHDNQCLTDQRKPLMCRQGAVQQMAW